MRNPVRSQQFWVLAPRHGEIVTADLDPMQEDEVRVRALYSGISRGTESIVFRGEVPTSQVEAMRAPFQEGQFPAPVKYGYQSVGVVEDGPERLRGRTVFCLYPHQDVYQVAAGRVHVLPDELPPARAVLAANMETAVNVVWDAHPSVGDRVVVVGGGVVGLLVAWLTQRIPATRVLLVDPNPAREEVAGALGVGWSKVPPLEDEERNADLVVHASGHPDGLACALELAGPEAVVVEASWFGTTTVPLPLGEAFHSRRLTIRSSQVGRVPADRRARWSTGRRLGLALRLLCHRALDRLVTGESAFETLPETMARLSASPGDALCHRVRYPRRPA